VADFIEHRAQSEPVFGVGGVEAYRLFTRRDGAVRIFVEPGGHGQMVVGWSIFGIDRNGAGKVRLGIAAAALHGKEEPDFIPYGGGLGVDRGRLLKGRHSAFAIPFGFECAAFGEPIGPLQGEEEERHHRQDVHALASL
jgi:hypothetical protein